MFAVGAIVAPNARSNNRRQPTSDGGLAILPGDASLDDENSWLPLQDVLALVKTCPVERKLLLLDVMQPFADGRAGVLANDAAARAEPIR